MTMFLAGWVAGSTITAILVSIGWSIIERPIGVTPSSEDVRQALGEPR